jgi:hypothetical protein
MEIYSASLREIGNRNTIEIQWKYTQLRFVK